MSSSLEYLQSKHIAELNSTSEQEEFFSEKDKEDAMNEDMQWKTEKRRKLLLLFAVLAASVTYQAGLNPPGGLWQGNKPDHVVGKVVPKDYHRRRYMVFFYCNATAFLSSVAIIVLVVNRKLFARGIQYNVPIACAILDLIGLIGAYAACNPRRASTYLLVFAVLVYLMLHVLVIIGSGSLAEKRRKHLLLFAVFAVLAVSVTYQLGLSPPGSLLQENKADHVVSDPVPNDNHRRRYMAFFYCNATAFVSSLAIIVLLMSRMLFERGIQSNVLSACLNLDLIGLTGAFAAGSSRRVSTSIYVFLLFAILVCIMVQLLVRVGSGSLAETSVLGHNGGRSKYLLIFTTLDPFWQIHTNAAGRCSESAGTAVVYEDDPNRSIKRSPREATWRVVSAAPHHMTGNQSVLLTSSYMPVHDGGNNGDGGVLIHPAAKGEAVPLRVRGSGSVRTESIALDDVWYVPGLDSNLVSTGQLVRQGCTVNLGPGGCRITRDGALVGTARFTKASQFELDFLKVSSSM